jgi:hypothetical protein
MERVQDTLNALSIEKLQDRLREAAEALDREHAVRLFPRLGRRGLQERSEDIPHPTQ